MSHKPLLLEVGLEEMPARFIDDAIEQLKNKMTAFFEDHRVSIGSVKTFATPRRLAVLIENVNEKQQDQVEESKGPAKKIAVDENGAWSKAALGFARGQGVDPEQLYFKAFKGEEYIYATKETKGEATLSLLPQLREIILSLTFPKNMRWGSYDLRYVRPIRWLLALYGEEVIPFNIVGVNTGNQSYGHRFLGEAITIHTPNEYATALQKHFVIADHVERKQAIQTQLEQLAAEMDWHIPLDDSLLNEVTHLVEYPTVLYGKYDEAFLQLPDEVLITTMKEHQRYFPVQDQQGTLLPYFVTVRNGDVDPKGIVAKGNEKVLRARLSDARFFYDEDKKLAISTALSQLENVVFHEELGTIGDKVRRIREISASLAAKVGMQGDETKSLERAAEICKFDLVTQMVNEFTELQGRMGQEYAKLAGESQEVSQAIQEHYKPRFAGDDLPENMVSGILSVADKIDTIVGCFSIGIIPTGSQDPYALRRQASGIVQIMLAEKWSITMTELFQVAIDAFHNRQLLKRGADEVMEDLASFFSQRLKNQLQETGIRYDVIDAVGAQHEVAPYAVLAKGKVISVQLDTEDLKSQVEAFTRVHNLAKKMDRDVSVQPERFTTKEEQALYDAYLSVKETFDKHMKQGEWEAAYHTLTTLRAPIDAFFDDVMVMVDDEHVRYNRLSLIVQVSTLIHEYADFTTLVFPNK
ncbi:glycine--tRNA ligase subunit beta [Caldalkalibacillus salinus]|uniref:glycine--tRNA ligase subunit beta n=1 Tax=Caldalkalibacillus salinus TaxID=2803787 RepID=UPI001920E68D|nr:glycine--tRNA ligase subunit beta [Caldalkalibacillus salinus]